ncbi:molybdenum cofactor guanylyltransferase [Phenylobacterium aquaticum]|nr:molybdenum cofactor guanylyltransferase [Phenylobacterium aquaticum]
MGGDKPLRHLAGRPLIAHALGLARAYSPTVAISVREAGQVADIEDTPLIIDSEGLAGPLAGLAAGLKFARTLGFERLLTLPCDMPCLPEDLERRLAVALVPPSRVAMAQAGDRLYPVCGLWVAGALDCLPSYTATGRSSLRGFAQHVGLSLAIWSDPTDVAFANVNEVRDLARLETVVGPRGGGVGSARSAPTRARATPI